MAAPGCETQRGPEQNPGGARRCDPWLRAQRRCGAAQQQAAQCCGYPSGLVVLGAVIAAPTSPAAVNSYTVPDIRKLTQPPFTACAL